MKKFICLALSAVFFSLPNIARAQSPEEAVTQIYDEQFQNSGLSDLYDSLPENTRNLLGDLGLSPSSGGLPKLSPKDVFNHILNLFKDGFKEPFRVSAALVGLLIIMSLVTTLVSQTQGSSAAELAGTLCVAATVLIPLYESMLAAIATLKSVAAFMAALVPIYCATLMAAGLSATGSAASALLLGATEAVTQAVSFFLAPFMGMYLALSVSASVSPLSSGGSLADLIKKTATWALSAVLTVFLGVLSLQTGISASADTLSIKAARYLAGSIPLVGGAVGETVSVVKSSLALLSHSAFGYGVIAIAALLLPVVAEFILWRLGLNVSIAVCGVLNSRKIEGLIRSCDAVFAFLLGVVIYVGLLFIISLSIVSGAAGGKAI